jgi:hypothetical protein
VQHLKVSARGETPRDIIRQADEMMCLVKNTTRDNVESRGVE